MHSSAESLSLGIIGAARQCLLQKREAHWLFNAQQSLGCYFNLSFAGGTQKDVYTQSKPRVGCTCRLGLFMERMCIEHSLLIATAHLAISVPEMNAYEI